MCIYIYIESKKKVSSSFHKNLMSVSGRATKMEEGLEVERCEEC